MSTDKSKGENTGRTDKQEEKIPDLPSTTTDQDANQVKGGRPRNPTEYK